MQIAATTLRRTLRFWPTILGFWSSARSFSSHRPGLRPEVLVLRLGAFDLEGALRENLVASRPC